MLALLHVVAVAMALVVQSWWPVSVAGVRMSSALAIAIKSEDQEAHAASRSAGRTTQDAGITASGCIRQDLFVRGIPLAAEIE